MSVIDNIETINEIIYTELDKIISRISRRYYFRLYMIRTDKKQKCNGTTRIMKTISDNDREKYKVMQDHFQDPAILFNELKIPKEDYSNWGNLSNGIENFTKKEHGIIYNSQEGSDYNKVTEKSNIDQVDWIKDNDEREVKILYSNHIQIAISRTTETITYILEVKDLDWNTKNLFYNESNFSFLKMVLDYFFNDYLEFRNKFELVKKYNEDSTQFIRRISRLFFGKIQSYLRSSAIDDKPKNEYYVNNLLENIDEISTKTYEGNSPFGSIMFLNQTILSANSDVIKYTIKFKIEDRINLEDSKRIRKLLELTTEGKDIYLIADHQFIYGLGEVLWGRFDKNTSFRLDFKGLSKYRLVLIRTEETDEKEGRIIIEDEQKLYQSDRSLKIIDRNLLTISFKNPNLTDGGYTTEKFKSIIRSEFFGNKVTKEQEKNIDKLEKIVKRARDQKHGTMVVITDEHTAKHELEILRKQSTLIEPMEINPGYIQFLTSIDGAIYFDLNGVCYAIGVILDGIAKEGAGDSSRGARYNSAHRYLEKLNDARKKCVIAIISEDGMVDIIPDINNEEKILMLVREIVDIIQGKNKEQNAALLKRKEAKLNKFENIDFQHIFRIAEEFRVNELYSKALDYYKKGFKKAANLFVGAKYHNQMGLCYFALGRERDLKMASDKFNHAINSCEYEPDKFYYYRNLGHAIFNICRIKQKDNIYKYKNIIKSMIVAHNRAIDIYNDYKLSNKTLYINCLNRRGIGYDWLSHTESSAEIKEEYLNKSVEDYTSYLFIKENNVVYQNRSKVYLELGRLEEYVKDLISAESLVSDAKVLDLIKGILDDNEDLVLTASEHYKSIISDQRKSDKLWRLLESYDIQMADYNSEIAPTSNIISHE